jgi:hypothetical protein
VTGQEAFEFAAAIAGVVVGLAAITILAVVGVAGVWQTARRAADASAAATRASLGVEELARHVATQLMAQPRTGNGQQFADLRQQAEALLEQERQLQEMARNLFDTAAIEGAAGQTELADVELAIGRLESTVGQMAASLANVIQLLERQQRG